MSLGADAGPMQSKPQTQSAKIPKIVPYANFEVDQVKRAVLKGVNEPKLSQVLTLLDMGENARAEFAICSVSS